MQALRWRRLGRLATLLAVLAAGVAAGALLMWGLSSPVPAGHAGAGPSGPAQEQTVWTCSMHPEIRRDGPGLCPKCYMELIPVQASSAGPTGPRQYATSPESAALMDVELAEVERRFPQAAVRMVGKVAYDETRLAYVTAWVGGRLERLYVDYTGVTVSQGDHMVELYSPELLSAQEELLQARRAVGEVGRSEYGLVRDSAQATVQAARERLGLWGLSEEQIAAIEQRGSAQDTVTINAPVSGIVVHKNAQEGMYVQTGTRIYTLADLSVVWVELAAYESDLAWLRYGQPVEFSTLSEPGETFTGTIAFIDPILDPATRTVRVRVNVPNEDGRLKPGMFVRAVVHSRVAAGGKVMEPQLAGKWISPMHPEIIKDGPGRCDVCGMPLVPAESLGFVAAEPGQAPLVIPATAPLLTGERAVVYVEVPDADEPTFEGREVTLGPRAGDWYIVREGLAEGERVVTRGGFKIDSALQIEARPSMMSPEGGQPVTGHDHGAMGGAGASTMDHSGAPAAGAPATAAPASGTTDEDAAALAPVYEAYLPVQQALADDELTEAQQSARALGEAVEAVDMTALSPPAHEVWMAHVGPMRTAADEVAAAEGIAEAREAFLALSQATIGLARRVEPPRPLYRVHCPMAFDNAGGDWLQRDRTIANPYYGARMLRCGSVTETLGQ